MPSQIKKGLFGILLVFGLLAGCCIYSEFKYARSISPQGILTVQDFFKRFGEPNSVYVVKHEGKDCYAFRGLYPPLQIPFGPMPSGPPVYVFDEQGKFVTWCSDSGDAPITFWQKWPLISTNKVEIKMVRQKLGLQ